jgi:hypothetical protein
LTGITHRSSHQPEVGVSVLLRITGGEEMFVKINILILCLVSMVLIISCVGVGGRSTAIKYAKDYLDREYFQEMNYRGVSHIIWVEPAQYHVYFSPKNNQEIIFEVLISHHLVLREPWTNSYGDHYKPDNYLLKKFEFETEILLYEKFKNIYVKKN